MSLLLLPHVKRSPSLCFAEYYALEKQAGAARSGVSACGALLEYETLELRVQPPSVEVASRGDSTTVSVFSANRAPRSALRQRRPARQGPPDALTRDPIRRQ